MAFKVFFSYAHKDELLLDKLKEHLAPLKNQGLIDGGWHDREIDAGAEWEPEIVRHLETADIILLLVSAAFMNSDYCYGMELKRAIRRHERREARVIPIILSPVDWQIPPLDKLQALPTDAKPVTGAGWHSIDDALLNVVKGIRVAIRNLQKRKQPGAPYQYQMDYVASQMNFHKPALTALRECDPELEAFVAWMIHHSAQPSFIDGAALQAQIEKLLQEISIVGDGDLRVLAEVTPDTLGVVADSCNYLIEELAMVVHRIRETAPSVFNELRDILKSIGEQKKTIRGAAQTLDAVAKSLPEGPSSSHLSQMSALLFEVCKGFGAIEVAVNKVGNYTHTLQVSTEGFRLPEHIPSLT